MNDLKADMTQSLSGVKWKHLFSWEHIASCTIVQSAFNTSSSRKTKANGRFLENCKMDMSGFRIETYTISKLHSHQQPIHGSTFCSSQRCSSLQSDGSFLFLYFSLNWFPHTCAGKLNGEESDNPEQDINNSGKLAKKTMRNVLLFTSQTAWLSVSSAKLS